MSIIDKISNIILRSEKMQNKSIRTRLILFSVLILVGSSVFTSAIAVIQSSKSLQSEVEMGLSSSVSESSKAVLGIVHEQTTYMQSIANGYLANNILSWDDKVDFLHEESIRMHYDSFWMSDLNGTAVQISKDKETMEIKDQKYFKNALDGKSSYTDAFIDGRPVMVVSAPIYEKYKITGVALAICNDLMSQGVSSDYKYGDTGYSYILNKKGEIISHPNNTYVAERLDLLEDSKSKPEQSQLADLLESRILKGETGTGKYMFTGTERMVSFKPVENTDWIMVVAIQASEINSHVSSLRGILLIFSGIALLLAILITYFMSNSIVKPIIHLTDAVKKLSQYDLTKEHNKLWDKYRNRKDEVGVISLAIYSLQENLSTLIDKTKGVSKTVLSSSEKLMSSSQESSLASEEIAKTVEEIAKGATEQAKEIEDGSLAADDLDHLIQQDMENLNSILENIVHLNSLKESGLNTISELNISNEDNRNSMKTIQDVINETNDRANKINEATQIIDSIAEQTNLLALNAAIEAARAGESGRGFAVVAEEIRQLAEQSSKSVKEIDAVIKALQNNAQNAVSTMEQVFKISNEQSNHVKDTEDKFNSISHAIDIIKGVVEHAGEGAKQMNEKKEAFLSIIQNLSAIAEENAATTEEVSASAQEQAATMMEVAQSSKDLKDLSETLEKLVEEFKL